MATSVSDGLVGDRPADRLIDSARVRSFLWLSSLLLVVLVACLILGEWPLVSDASLSEVTLWVVAALASDLMLVRVGRGVTLSMSLPVTLAAALLFPPGIAAGIAFLGCLDPNEIRGKSSVARIVFNRSQVAVATAAAALVFQSGHASPFAWPQVVGWSFLALGADFLVNSAFVVPTVVLKSRVSVPAALRGLFGSAPLHAVLLYASMCLVAPLLAAVYVIAGGWALVSFMVPLMLAREALVRAERLHQASLELRAKSEALRRTTESVSDERRDERVVLAGELHDDLLPALYKVHLMGQVLKQDLDSGRLLDLDRDLPELLGATAIAQESVRAIVGQLRRSSLGPGGLSGTIRQFANHLEASGAPRIDLLLSDVRGSESVHFVLYQAAREAMLNASLYSQTDVIRVHLVEDANELRLLVSDDGIGFDLESVDVQNHFGLQFMKERIEALGGRLTVDSRLGRGTTIGVSVPLGIPNT
jgi:signal transduction histidine kinase